MPILLPIPQRGAYSIEHIIGGFVFLLICLMAVESTHWLLLRQALNTALLDSARIAATQQAHPIIIEESFERNLKAIAAFNLSKTNSTWQIERLMPTPAPSSAVRHSYQALQYSQGKHSVFQDNTLHLRLYYGHKPLTPVIQKALQLLATDEISLLNNYFSKGLVPIRTEVKVAMQSDQPAQRFQATARVRYTAATPPLSPESQEWHYQPLEQTSPPFLTEYLTDHKETEFLACMPTS